MRDNSYSKVMEKRLLSWLVKEIAGLKKSVGFVKLHG